MACRKDSTVLRPLDGVTRHHETENACVLQLAFVGLSQRENFYLTF